MTKRDANGFTLIELLIVVAIIGIIAAVAIPNLLNAVDKGKQKRSMADLRALGVAVEAYAVDNSSYPVASDTGGLATALVPIYVKTMSSRDGWNNLFQINSTATAYTLYSAGKDGIGSNCAAGTTTLFVDEICFSNGRFLRWPDGLQK